MILFFVRDTPRPGGSKRAFSHKGRAWVVDANPHTKTWRDSVRAAALKAYLGEPLEGPLYMEYIFYFKRPNSHYGTGKNQAVLKDNAPKYHTKQPDLTKLIRSTEDALTGIIYVDDAQVCKRSDSKQYMGTSNHEGVSIFIKPLD